MSTVDTLEPRASEERSIIRRVAEAEAPVGCTMPVTATSGDGLPTLPSCVLPMGFQVPTPCLTL